jgi:hypothetical protein
MTALSRAKSDFVWEKNTPSDLIFGFLKERCPSLGKIRKQLLRAKPHLSNSKCSNSNAALVVIIFRLFFLKLSSRHSFPTLF